MSDFNHFSQIAGSLGPVVRDIVETTALQIQQVAQDIVPVDTGNLKNSIQAEMTGNTSAIVSANTEYAAAVEFGRSDLPNYPAQPYMTPAAERARTSFEAALGNIERALGGS